VYDFNSFRLLLGLVVHDDLVHDVQYLWLDKCFNFFSFDYFGITIMSSEMVAIFFSHKFCHISKYYIFTLIFNFIVVIRPHN